MGTRLLLCGAIRPFGTDRPLEPADLELSYTELRRLGLAGWLGRSVTSGESHTNAILSNFARGDPAPPVLHTRNPGPAFIAYNPQAPCRVVEWPSLGALLRLVQRERPEIVGVSSMTQEFGKVELMVQALRAVAPRTRIVLGSYVVATPQCERLGDSVDALTTDEGAGYFRRLFGEDERTPYRNPPLRVSPTMSHHGLRVPTALRRLFAFDPVFVALGLGCRMRCRFCATSNFWGGYRPLLRSGREVYHSLRAVARARQSGPLLLGQRRRLPRPS